MEGRHVDDVIQSAATRLQGGLKIGECETDLRLEVWLGSAVAAASDLPGYEQEIA